MIQGYDLVWTPYLRDIDIKSNEWPWVEEHWKDEVKKYIIKMWMEPVPNGSSRKPLGFVAYRFMNIKDLIEREERGTVIHLLKLAVHPNHRNRGIGTTLLENVEKIAKFQDVKILVVILHEDDKDGRDWLIKRGFLSRTLLVSRFPDGQDGYSFVKELE